MNVNLLAADAWNLAGWVMLHFLWIGTGLLALAAVVRTALQRSTPGLRYATTLALFVAVAISPLAIAAWIVHVAGLREVSSAHSSVAANASSRTREPSTVLHVTRGSAPAYDGLPATTMSANEPSRQVSADTPSTSGLVADKNERQDIGAALASTANQTPRISSVAPPEHADRASPTPTNAPSAPFTLHTIAGRIASFLPALWLVGTPLTLLLLTTGALGAKRLKRQSRRLVDHPITAQLRQLCDSLQVRSRVAVAICERLKAPLLLGVVRPVVLLPPSALLGWSPEQLEMVLLHELAHVRRWDNLVNLMQRVVESLYFFHPAIWLMSEWLRRDRELCCDALVVAHSQSEAPRPAYARLLIDLAAKQRGYRSTAAGVAIARGGLRHRVRRVLRQEEETMRLSLSGLWLAVLAVCLGVGVALAWQPRRGAAESDDSPPKPPREQTASTDNLEPSLSLTQVEDPAEGLPSADAAEQTERSVAKSDLRYDGKTFETWRREWRTELKTEKRTEAIRALAAFGANGFGTEAAETILQVVKNYNAQNMVSSQPRETPEADLIHTAVMAFVGSGNRIPPADAMPTLLAQLKSNANLKWFALHCIRSVATTDNEMIPHLITLSKHDSWQMRRTALEKLSQIDGALKQTAAIQSFREALTDQEPLVAEIAFNALFPIAIHDAYDEFGNSEDGFENTVDEEYGQQRSAGRVGYVPELIEALKSGEAEIQNHAAHALHGLGQRAKPAVPALVEMLRTSSEDDQKAALLGIGVLRFPAREATPHIQAIFDAKRGELRRAALAALAGRSEPEAFVSRAMTLLTSEEAADRNTASSLLFNLTHAKEVTPKLLEALGVPLELAGVSDLEQAFPKEQLDVRITILETLNGLNEIAPQPSLKRAALVSLLSPHESERAAAFDFFWRTQDSDGGVNGLHELRNATDVESVLAQINRSIEWFEQRWDTLGKETRGRFGRGSSR